MRSCAVVSRYLRKRGDNSFHVKGLFIDDDCTVVAGNDLNPLAWALNLESGLLNRLL